MKYWFWLLFVFLIVVIPVGTFFGASVVVADEYNLSQDDARWVLIQAVVHAAWYKQVSILALFAALAYLSARYTLLGKI